MIEISETTILVGATFTFLAGALFGMWLLHSIAKDVDKIVEKHIMQRMK